MLMKNKSNIILIGFMGSGKTTIGLNLSKTIHYHFIDSDLEIENEIGMSISDYFIKYGENRFRALEKRIIKKLALGFRQVIATGGGIVKNHENIKCLKSSGILIYFNASPKHIYSNLKEDSTRPLLNVDDKYNKIKHLLNERKVLYEKYSDITVDVDGKTIEEITSFIINSLEVGQ